MARKREGPVKSNGARIPTYQSAEHGGKKSGLLGKVLKKTVEKADGKKAPTTVLDTIPYETISPDGICYVGDNYYTKMVQFYDINYQLAQDEERRHIFGDYCKFINYFDDSIHFQLCFINQKSDMEEYQKVISIPYQYDQFNTVRQEYAAYLQSQLEKGNNGFSKNKYLVFGIHAENRKKAVSKLSKIEADILYRFKQMGCKCIPVDGLERLKILHDFMNQDTMEKFMLRSFHDVARTGLTPKNYIMPTSFDFRAKDFYRIGDMFATTSMLMISASEISDEMLKELLNMEDPMNISIHVDAYSPSEALKYVKGKMSDIDMMKINQQKKASENGYDMDIMSSDITTYSQEAANILSDLQQRNEKYFKITFTITTMNMNLQKLKTFRESLSNNIQSANCILRRLDHRQEQGFITGLPLGINYIKQDRHLTTSATAVFVPFITQELFMDSPESLYMGLNSISNGMIMADRKLLKNPNGLILGTPGSGKSFATKREILNAFLVTQDDIIICDPEAEYYPLVNYLGGQVVKIGQNSNHYINPLDLSFNYSEEDDPLTFKTDFILSFMELIVGGKSGLKPEEISVIDYAVRNMYKRYWPYMCNGTMPILQDLYYELMVDPNNATAMHIARCMYTYVEGSNNVFNHRTNVDLSNRIICFDIKSLGNSLKKLGMLVVQDAVWNRVTYNREIRKYTRFYIDEFHLLLRDEITAAYSVEIWKRFRKWGGIPTGITQNVKDFLASKEIENIFDNSDFVYILNQGADDREILAQKLKIPENMVKYISNANQGEGIIFFGDVIIPFVDRFPKDTLMYKLITTKPQETGDSNGAGGYAYAVPYQGTYTGP